MLDYQRFVSYLYRYEHGVKGDNIGYIRGETRKEQCRITVGVRDPRGIEISNYNVYLFRILAAGKTKCIPVGTLQLRNGMGEFKYVSSSNNLFGSGLLLGDFDGIVLVYNQQFFYATKWTDEELEWNWLFEEKEEASGRSLQTEERAASSEEAGHEVSTVDAADHEVSTADAADHEVPNSDAADSETTVMRDEENDVAAAGLENDLETNTKQTDIPLEEQKSILEELLESHPSLPAFANQELFDCVRITPNEIGLMRMENWRLGSNSFLIHGYYCYQYLLLGKIRYQDGEQRYILGVPGIFNNKEQYIATIFGFEQFVPVKQTNVRTGQFGYWMTELVS